MVHVPSPTILFVLLTPAVAALSGQGTRRLGFAGLCALGFGLASLSVASGKTLAHLGPGVFAEPAGLASVSSGFLIAESGLLLAGAAFALIAGAAAFHARATRSDQILGVLLGVMALLASVSVAPLFAAAGVAWTLLAGLSVAAALGALVKLGPIVGASRWSATLGRMAETRTALPRSPLKSADGIALVAFAAGALGVVASSGLIGVLGGCLLAAGAAQVLAMRSGTAGLRPVLPILSLGLVPVYWLMATVAGPGGQSMTALPDAPFSSAAEILLIPGLLLTSWGLLALWPLGPFVPTALLAPLGIELMIRIGADILPEGLLHWQPLVAPLLVVAILCAACSGELFGAGNALALLGIASLSSVGRTGGLVLSLLVAGGVLLLQMRAGGMRRALRLAGAPLVAWSFLLVMEAALGTQVVYTVLAAAATVLALCAFQPAER